VLARGILQVGDLWAELQDCIHATVGPAAQDLVGASGSTDPVLCLSCYWQIRGMWGMLRGPTPLWKQ